MPTSYTSLLGFALPATGELSGTWGDTVNNSITQLVEDSVAGTATQSVAGGDWTLSTTGSGAANQARCAIIRPTGSPGVSRNVIAPASSKAYIVDNQSNAAVVFKASATTGVTIAAGSKSLVAWNGSDFVEVGQAGDVDGPNSATDNAIARFDGTSGKIIQNSVVTIADTTGDIAGVGSITSTSASGILTRAAATQDGVIMAGRAGGTSSYAVTFTPTTLSANQTLTLPDASGTILQSGTPVTVGQGGTGLTTLTANNVILGNGASNVQFVAPGTAGNILTSNGTTWTSAAGIASPLSVVGNSTAGAELRLPEDTDNGNNYVAIKAADSLASNITFTLPSSDGTNGQYLQTNGSGVLSFSTVAAGFSAGTVMLFAQTAAPTGWTKNTSTGNNSALRVVTGSASSGGSVDFTTAFASQTPSGSVSISAISGSAGNTTLTTPQIPSHTHGIYTPSVPNPPVPKALSNGTFIPAQSTSTAALTSTGGDGSHSHPFSFSSGTATFTGNAINLAVKYVDVIQATKD